MIESITKDGVAVLAMRHGKANALDTEQVGGSFHETIHDALAIAPSDCMSGCAVSLAAGLPV